MIGHAVPPFAVRLDLARELVARSDDLIDRLGVEWGDRAFAAAADANRHRQRIRDVDVSTGLDRACAPSGEGHARIVAAVLACQPCVHLRSAGPALQFADLNHRLLLCGRCARTRRRVVDDRRCEVCDEVDSMFVEFSIVVGFVLAAGNAGLSCCAPLLGMVAA